jgi:hypothetical protein
MTDAAAAPAERRVKCKQAFADGSGAFRRVNFTGRERVWYNLER